MGRRLEITNISKSPLGYNELGKSKPTMIQPFETEVLDLDDATANLIEAMANSDAPKVEMVDKGQIEAGAAKPPREKAASAADTMGDSELREENTSLTRQLISARQEIASLEDRLEASQRELATLQKASDGVEPKEYEVGDFVSRALERAGIENLADLQAALDAIEEAFEPFAKFDPDGDLQPGGSAGAADRQAAETQTSTTPPPGPQTDQFDDMDDDALRAYILAQPPHKAAHVNAKRETLLKKARELDAGAAPDTQSGEPDEAV